MEINTKTLGSIFPGFFSLLKPMDVAIEITIHGLNASISDLINLIFETKCILYLTDTV